ncbi:MAG: class I SAM-dependent methyltransferase [Planctomycetota bacterium]
MGETARFAFGANWASFLNTIDAEAYEQAQRSLRELLQTDSLVNKRFLDIGSGSGLFSLAAFQMGASVTSMDVDPDSVRCTQTCQNQALQSASSQITAPHWEVIEGSVLDKALMGRLGEYDVVYSWGVLHHTGEMSHAIELASQRVALGGQLVIAIYNDQGGASRRWLAIKQTYHRLPKSIRPLFVGMVASVYEAKFAVARLFAGRNPLPFSDWKAKRRDRGMSVWHDWVDWVGGLPFEFAKPEGIIMPLIQKEFELRRLTTVGSGWGCNQYVFQRGDSIST